MIKRVVSKASILAEDKNGNIIKSEAISSPLKINGWQGQTDERLGVEYGVTINLGNYESARVTVYLETTTNRDLRDSTLTEVEAWVNKAVGDLVSELRVS